MSTVREGGEPPASTARMSFISLAAWDRMSVPEKWRSWRVGERIHPLDIPELERRNRAHQKRAATAKLAL